MPSKFDFGNGNTRTLVRANYKNAVKGIEYTLVYLDFLHLFLNPAIGEGLVKLLYPEKPRHPRQKYLLTVKGLTIYQELGQAKLVKENDT